MFLSKTIFEQWQMILKDNYVLVYQRTFYCRNGSKIKMENTYRPCGWYFMNI